MPEPKKFGSFFLSVFAVFLLRIRTAEIEGRDGVAVFYFAVKPDVDPQKDRQGDGGDQAGGKQALPARKAADGGDQRQEIQTGQKDDADQRRDLFGGFLFFHEELLFVWRGETALRRGMGGSVSPWCYSYYSVSRRRFQEFGFSHKMEEQRQFTMEIRKTVMQDLDAVREIYAYAREQMRLNGNPDQWGTNRPSEEKIRKDIRNGNSYVLLHEGEICGVFSFLIGPDETYAEIEGKWLNCEEYGTIHRAASNGKVHGVFRQILDFCRKLEPNIRIDTHEANSVMRHILETNGFSKCGIIHVDDGTPRIAYQKVFSPDDPL